MQATSGAITSASRRPISRDSNASWPAPVHRALEEAQSVVGSHHHPGSGDEREDDLRLQQCIEDVELADEVGRSRHRQGGHGDDQKQGGEDRRPQRLPSQLAQVLAAGALRENGDDQQQRHDDDAVVDHLQQCSVGPVGSQGKDPGGDEAELGDRGVAGDQPHLGLREGHHRAVEDRGQRDRQHHLLELDRRGGKERQHDLQEAVGGDLREHGRRTRQAPGAAPHGRRPPSTRAAERPAS